MYELSKHTHNSGKQRVSGGFKPGNMNAFIFAGAAGGKRKKKRIKHGK